MRKLFMLAVMLAAFAVPYGAYAGCASCARPGSDYRSAPVARSWAGVMPGVAYTPTATYCAPAPVAVDCGPCIPTVPTCYRTTNRPCFPSDLGVGRVLSHIFAPQCVPECEPCVACP